MEVVNSNNIQNTEGNVNKGLAMEFRNNIESPERRSRLLKSHPELKDAVAYYERDESDFTKNGNLDAVAVRLLHAKKGLMALQIETNGLEFFSSEAVKQRLSEIFTQHIQPEERNQLPPKMADQERREQMLKDYPELNTAADRYKDIEALLVQDGGLNKQDVAILKNVADNLAQKIQKDGSAAYGPTTGVVEQAHER